jgi:hypothetical protein
LDGDNFRNAVRALQEARRLAVNGKLDVETWKALVANDSAPVVKPYTISDADVAGPFTKAIPTSLEEMAKLPGLSYTRPVAEIAEKFHMSESLLRQLNPRVDFERVGTEIMVADVQEMKLRSGPRSVEVVPPEAANGPTAVAIVVDKPAGNVRAYDRDGALLAFYPATTPSTKVRFLALTACA